MYPVALALALATAAVAQIAPPSFVPVELPLAGEPVRVASARLDPGPTDDLVVLSRRSTGVYDLVTAGVVGSTVDFKVHAGLAQLGYLNTPELVASEVDGNAFADVGLTTLFLDQYLLGNGDLTLQGIAPLPTAGGSQYGVGFTDVDGDGWRDSVLLVNDFGGSYLDFGLNDGTGIFGAPNFVDAPGSGAGAEARLHFADVLGQGVDSTFVTRNVGLYRSQWPAGPTTNELLLAGDFAEVGSGDFDGVGGLDLAVCGRGSGRVSVLLNDGQGGFQVATTYVTGRFPESLAIADLDGDGDLDLAVANRRSSDVSILCNDGAGAFAACGTWPVGAQPRDITAGDLDGNGRVDLAVACEGSGTVTLLLGL